MVVVAKKIDWLTVDLYVPVMLMDYSVMNSGSYTCNKSEGLISLSNLKNSFCSSFIRIDFTIYRLLTTIKLLLLIRMLNNRPSKNLNRIIRLFTAKFKETLWKTY